jgi:hypothetical protein
MRENEATWLLQVISMTRKTIAPGTVHGLLPKTTQFVASCLTNEPLAKTPQTVYDQKGRQLSRCLYEQDDLDDNDLSELKKLYHWSI